VIPETFGLVVLPKGYFPHKFNTDKNQEYVGAYQDKIYYGYDEMKNVDREKFDEWLAKISAVSRKLYSRNALLNRTYCGVKCQFQLVDRHVSIKYT